MNSIRQICMLLAVCLSASPIHAKELSELKVLFVGDERSVEYLPFLMDHVAAASSVERGKFKPADAGDYDVVLLDWHQGEDSQDMKNLASPLGARKEWNKPTVLLGSAGLLVAVSWEARGGIGCTCMEPLAYGLRQHEIFDKPFKIDQTKMISVPTPAEFESEIKDPEIRVLPLVDDRTKPWSAGWCTYSSGFDRNPDIELFCGGVNAKTPTAAGFWRQGNLLHFGFEQSPTEMNEVGRQLLLNSIAYISRFSDDRPIAVTPSVFARPTARSRMTMARWLKNPEYPVDYIQSVVAPAVWGELSALSGREAMLTWAEDQGRFLRPDKEQKWELDSDLVALGVPFDDPGFFDKTIADLDSGDTKRVARAQRLLELYAPSGPKSEKAGEWKAWHKENRDYLFASDEGDYRWYIDPLAKRRGVPADELRGPKRADAQ